MDSPSKRAQLSEDMVVPADKIEEGMDGLPEEIWTDMKNNENYIFWALMFLNGSVLWAYYSCLSAQNFYETRFADSGLDFSFLTTLVTSWPMAVGLAFQIVSGTDKKFGQKPRVIVGYGIFIVMAILIIVFSAINFSSEHTGAMLVLICFAFVGFGNSCSEAVFYSIAALFPIEKFTNAVQIGNVVAGVLNVTIQTIIRLLVDGTKAPTNSSANNVSFYIFFALLIVVLLTALWFYHRLLKLPCVAYLIDRNEEASKTKDLGIHPMHNLSELFRVFKIIWVPALAQFLVLFVSLVVYPGFGCAAARNVSSPFIASTESTTVTWYCSPGIIGSYNYGDFFGRIMCTAAVYKIFNMPLSFGMTVLRFAFIPLLLMGISGTSIYVFGQSVHGSLVWNVFINLCIGFTNGLLSTVTMGRAPRMLPAEDRETGGSVMAFFLFFGICSGSTIGYFASTYGWFGL